ncbi:MAG TPA: HAD-IIA family hydrolase [Amycolatopsis sp.]|nr:HAD-IIA family hydrolase [Amycolatopsis sp.]
MTRDGALLSTYDAVLLDLDGTVYHGARPIAGVAESVRDLREHGTVVRYVTNNASKAPRDVADTLRGMDIDAEADEVSTSAQAAAKILGERVASGKQVVVVGAPALMDEVSAVGLEPVRETGDDVAAVVQGHWPETGWHNLAEACLAIRAGALWVACNVDTTLPTERGQLPGNGAMVAALRTATGVEPVVAGKPAAPLLHTAVASAKAEKALVVGDRLDTDIAGAVEAGLDSLLVLTGVATPASVLRATPAERPTYLAEDLRGLSGDIDDLVIGPQKGWHVETTGGTLVVSGSGDAYGLLRALCHVAWETGLTAVHGEDNAARAALAGLGLTEPA